MTFKRKWVASAAALAALVGVSLWQAPAIKAQGIQLLTSLSGTEQVVLNYPCTVSCGVTTSVLAGYTRGTGLLYTATGTTASTGTTAEQTLGSYSLPANTLATGTRLRIGAAFLMAANTNTKTVKCYFGTSAISSGALLTNNKNGSCQVNVNGIAGTSLQTVTGNMLVDTTPITGYYNAGTDDETGAITIKITATQGSAQAADVVLNDFWVERLGN